ncbi:DUF4123 domain-containing protein [Oceanicola sp. 502str15]|uniref:DUF4123 domain-containing protein n=1 Tax=Oceanicola sp. 502str15 TaxID=2696061 RepID=UPI00209432E9|nr:DUF4123 domain-containing protein [Oceanicola sp. 502str15]MCO6381226.1 hypothetical protein [Oceanicola sp. 502str15]
MSDSAPKDQLGSLLRRLPGQIFAVIDGAHFDDLPGRIRDVGLEALPLFTDEIDLPALGRGPHLVACPNLFAVEQVTDVCAGVPAVVWWDWPDQGEKTAGNIYAHLRRLNLVEIPANRAEPIVGRRQVGAVDRGAGWETVLFRHGDPNVMSLLIPVLDEEQRGQLFGAALSVAMQPPGREVTHTANPSHNAPPGFGRLRLRSAQYDELAGQHGRGLRRRAVLELSDAMPGRTAEEREARVAAAYDRAESFGCMTLDQIWEFIHLDSRWGAKFELAKGHEKVLEALKMPDASAEERLWRAEMELGFAK